MKSSLQPRMLRKCTLKILPRSPNQRITSPIWLRGSSSISPTVPLAEVQAVVRAFVQRHEALQAFDGPQHAGDPFVAGRGVRVVRMTGEAHIIRGCNRDDRAQETVDARPVFFFVEGAGDAGRRAVVRLAPTERGIA